MRKYTRNWRSGRFSAMALIAIALFALTALWLIRAGAPSDVVRPAQAAALRDTDKLKVNPVVDRPEREKHERQGEITNLQAQVRHLAFKLEEQERTQLTTSKWQQDAHQAEISSLKRVHAAEIANLHAKKTCQKVAAGGARQSSAYSICSAERARLLTKLQRCGTAQRVNINAVPAKQISAVIKPCGLSKKMILELNR